MKTFSKNTKWWAFSGLALMLIVFTAWRAGNEQENIQTPYDYEDTVKPRKKYNNRHEISESELNQAIKDLERATIGMEKNIKIDFDKLDKEMKVAMNELKKIDFDKIGREIEASLKNINWDKTRVEVDKAFREAEKSLKEVDMKKTKEELEQVKEKMESHKIFSESFADNIKASVETGLAAARVGIEAAKKELALLKEFIDTLEKDGLIDKKKGYKISIKDGELYINGTKQSKEVNDKYRKYIKDREEDYTITSDEEGSVRI